MSKLCPQGHQLTGWNRLPATAKVASRFKRCRKCYNAATLERAHNGHCLPPDTPAVMASYKEPLRPVEGGFGYHGTVAYNVEETHTQCHICGHFYKYLGGHIARRHGINMRNYKIKYGLPISLSMSAPKKPSPMYERWAKMDEAERVRIVAHLKSKQQSGTSRPHAKPRLGKSLYEKNLEGRCPDQLLDKIEQHAKELGRAPSRREFAAKYGTGYQQSVTLTFGSWSEALKILQLTPKKKGYAPMYDKALLVKLLIEFRDRNGREPMAADTRRGTLPAMQTFTRSFGSWKKAKEYAA